MQVCTDLIVGVAQLCPKRGCIIISLCDNVNYVILKVDHAKSYSLEKRVSYQLCNPPLRLYDREL